jgi:peptide/nickel transport system permease protein
MALPIRAYATSRAKELMAQQASLLLKAQAAPGRLPSGETPWSRAWRRFRRHKMAMAGVIFLALLIVGTIAAPVVIGLDPTKMDPRQSMKPPSAEHILGTDVAGRDIWARLVFGARVSLAVGLVSVSISIAISLILGTLSGFYGGAVDMIIMRFTDVMMVFPGLILVIAVVSVLGPSIFNVMIVLGVLGWTGTTRLLRGQILSVRELDYVLAARAIGAPNGRIMMAHVLPNALAPLLVAATFSIAGAILTEAGLSYLGLGVLPPAASWGSMLNAANSITVLERNWWVWIPPGIAVLLTVMAINFIGDGLRDALDPRTTMR